MCLKDDIEARKKMAGFLKKARKIVADHRAEYQGEYTMFGFTEVAIPAAAAFFGADAATAAAIGAGVGTIGTDVGIGALTGAGLGGLEGAVTGGNIGQGILHGAEAGGLTGGGIGLGGALAGGLGATAGSLGATAGDVLGGAAGGALGSTATGGNPLTGALEGGVSGGIASAFSGSGTPSTDPSTGAAAPSNVPANTPSAGSYGGGASGGASAPAGFQGGGDILNDYTQGLGGSQATSLPSVASQIDNTNGLSGTGSAVSSSNSPGSNLSAGISDTGLNAPATPTISSTLNSINPFSTPTDPLAAANGVAPGAANFANSAAADEAGGFGGYGATGFGSGAGATTGMTADQQAAYGVSPSLASAGNAAGGAAAKAPNSIGELFKDPSLGNLGSALANNIGPLAAAGGIGLDALKGNKQSGAEKNIEAQAGQQAQQGQQLEQYLQTGTLPAGLQAGVNQSLQSTIASIKSRYASMGQSGSSAEQQDIANAQSQSQAQAAQMQEQLLSTGISETGMSSQLYNELMKNSIANDTNLSNAIASFSAAAAGGGNFGKGGQIQALNGL